MAEGIPTGRTYFGFVFIWAVLAVPSAGILAFSLLWSGYRSAGVFVIVVAIYLFVRHARAIGRRAKQAVRRNRALTP